MKVQLAYPYEGHKPDEIVEVDDAVGRTLISDGFARPVVDEKRSTSNTRNISKEESEQ